MLLAPQLLIVGLSQSISFSLCEHFPPIDVHSYNKFYYVILFRKSNEMCIDRIIIRQCAVVTRTVKTYIGFSCAVHYSLQLDRDELVRQLRQVIKYS